MLLTSASGESLHAAHGTSEAMLSYGHTLKGEVTTVQAAGTKPLSTCVCIWVHVCEYTDSVVPAQGAKG